MDFFFVIWLMWAKGTTIRPTNFHWFMGYGCGFIVLITLLCVYVLYVFGSVFVICFIR